MITPKLKDEILADIITKGTESKNPNLSYSHSVEYFGINSNTLGLILDQFERYGLVKLSPNKQSVGVWLKMEAIDFQGHGGFQVAEAVKLAELDKLYYELEKLKKEDPEGKWSQRATLVMTAISTVMPYLKPN